MFWSDLVANAPTFFLIFSRVFALASVAPLLSSAAIPGAARAGFTLLVTFVVFPVTQMYPVPDVALIYLLLVVGEVFIGLIYGFVIQIVYAAFQTAGQFFSMQMGFSASMVFDPMSQEELPLLGQYFNLGAMFLFLTSGGLQKTYLGGVQYSFRTISAYQIASAGEQWLSFFIGAMGVLFQQALVLAFPIIGTLFLVSLSMGLLAKAAPQMNLLMLGFPISITVAFVVLILVMPLILESFIGLIEQAFVEASFLLKIQGATP